MLLMYGILNTLDEADEIRLTKRAMQHASVSPVLDQHDFTSLHQFSTTDFTLNLESRLTNDLVKAVGIRMNST